MIVLVGAAGSGKGTQGHFLKATTGYDYISTGEYLREQGTPEQLELIKNGHLLPDAEIIELVNSLFSRSVDPNKIILDGFPRTVVQTDWLLSQVAAGRIFAPKVVNLEVDQEVMFDRLMNRARHDDTEQVIRHRLESYEAVTRPVLQHFQKAGIPVLNIDAGQAPDVVRQAIQQKLEV